jgi:pentatricopeptide repeat protein
MPPRKPLTVLLKSATRPEHLLQLHAAMLKSSHFPHHAFPTARLLASPLAPLPYALSLFAAVPRPTLFHHTILLRALSGCPSRASLVSSLSVLASARARLPELDEFAFQPLLALCAKIPNDAEEASLGKQLHAHVVRYGFLDVLSLRNVLCHFYFCCGGGDTADARRLFDEMQERDTVSWNTVIGGYARAVEAADAVGMFNSMRWCAVDVNVTAVVTLFGCGWRGESVQGFCIKAGIHGEVKVAAAMVGMYARLGSVESARKVFDEATVKDLVLHNCMVDGYAKTEQIHEALSLVEKMRQQGMRLSSGTLVGVLSACAASGALVAGHHIHELVLDAGLELDTALGTALMDMYFKCGCPNEALFVFYSMNDRDVKAWTAVIMGFAVNGQLGAATSLFRTMEKDGVAPNKVTFLALLSACTHGGQVQEGKMFLESMVLRYGLLPGPEHYGCVIDLLGRAGRLDEAYELIQRTSSHGDATAWRALLAACRIHGHVEMGKMAQAHLNDMGEYHPSDAILLSSSYASQGQWDEIAQVRDSEEQKKLVEKKEAGRSLVVMTC